ncbi:acyltransferase [Chamaesiphon sp. OTE_75_metabat_556]|uniref:acyltransferase family protein n=1 Tax=Chamaesiphon sp. OTE_75_metabat_556 TaxID=2964692 RepID=UPI00286B0D01|nr:acyltransferase [Chamaesiphon sp. OTE_75_metabat_556]
MDGVVKFGMTLICFGISILTAKFISRHHLFSFLKLRQGRYGSIDGLRGFLAISVLFHHFIITWYWKASGKWTRPPEDYYQNYGKVSVAIFFAITGFLFVSKILKDSGKINWIEFYESRIFRIYPLYIFAMLIVTIIVFSSSFKLEVSLGQIVKGYTQWLTFYYPGGIVNNFLDTKLVIAGVDWTLRYEWLFYIFLPIITIAIIRLGRVGGLFLFTVCVYLFNKPMQIDSMDTSFSIFFAIGGLSAYLNRRYKIPNSIIKSKLVSSLAALAIAFAIFRPITFDSVHVVMISLFFIPIVLGNDLFGVFSLKSSILLGEISYSIYLLHGIVIYLAFSVLKIAVLKNISLQEYLIFMPVMCVAVILISALTFISIEKPSIDFGRTYPISRMLRSAAINAKKLLQRAS